MKTYIMISIKATLIASTAIGSVLFIPCITSAQPSTDVPATHGTETTRVLKGSQPKDRRRNMVVMTQYSASDENKNVETDSANNVEVVDAKADNLTSIPAQQDHDTIVVTGSHIRGVDIPVGSNLITIDRQEIERQGYGTARDLTQDILQNFGGGATGERQSNIAEGGNLSYGASLNLRGLGGAATLTLINGRRIPSTGFTGSIADISSIPVSVIERVEVLPDGASAVYGSDAVAGVVNFILRQNMEGFETRLRYGFATEAAVDEYEIGQLAGASWETGSVVLSYDYHRRDRLAAADRPFTRSADMRRFGGEDYRLVFGQPGNIYDPATQAILYAIPPGQDGRELRVDELLPPEFADKTDTGQYVDIMPEQRRHGAYVYVRQEISRNIELFAEGRYAHRKFSTNTPPLVALLVVPSSNPYYLNIDDTGAPNVVAYSFENELGNTEYKGNAESYNLTGGVELNHPQRWSTQAYVAYTRDDSINQGRVLDLAALSPLLASTDPERALNPFGNGYINDPELLFNATRLSIVELDADVLQTNITSNGPLINLWGDNTIRAAVGIDYRKYNFSRVDGDDDDSMADVKRETEAVFGELFVPLVDEQDGIRLVHKLELSLSARYEQHRDTSEKPQRIKRKKQQSTDPRIGILFGLTEWFRLNANYGTSFRAPSLDALTTLPAASTSFTSDPFAPGGVSYLLEISGAEKDLQNEKADTWGAGTAIDPPFLPNLRLKFNYFYIKFNNQVGQPPNSAVVMADPAYSSLVIRNPTMEQITAACSGVPLNRRFVSPGDCENAGIVTAIYDSRFRNISSTVVSGVDGEINYSVNLEKLGVIYASVSGTYLIDFKKRLLEDAPYVNHLNTQGNPVDFRMRTTLSWSFANGITVSGDLNYTDDYRDNIRNRKIGSWTTVDLAVGFSAENYLKPIWMRGTSLQVNINNVFENNPPFFEDSLTRFAYDAANAEALGRFISINIIKKW